MTTLIEELQTNPVYAELIAANNDEGVAALINSTMVSVVGVIGRDELATWAAATGMRAIIEDVANNANSPYRASALSIIDVLRGAAPGINLGKPTNVQLLDNWEQGGLLSAENKASFVALATHDVQRSIFLFGKLISASEVAAVVRDALGNSLLGV